MQTLKLTKKYEKYPEYKDSGIEWVGKIPGEWSAAPLRSVASENQLKNSDGLCQNLLSLSYGRIIEKDINSNEGLLPESFNTYQIVKKGNIVFRLTDLQNDKKSLRVGHVDSSEPGIITSAYLALNIQNRLNDRYAYYLLHAYDLQKVFYGMGGGVRQTLDFQDFKYLPIIFPDHKAQVKIADYLDAKASSIDQIIKKKQRQIELLKEEIVSIAMNEQVNGKGKTMRIGNLFKLADKPICLEDYSEYTALGLYNRGRGLFHKEPQLGKDIKESDFYKVIPKDLIISGQFAWEGAVALADKDENECVVSHRYYLLRDGVVKTEYLLALLMTKFGDHLLNESSRGSAGRNKPLNVKVLLKEKIRVPAKGVEEKIESLLIKMRSIQGNIRKSVNLLEEYKCSLISNVVTGKIKV